MPTPPTDSAACLTGTAGAAAGCVCRPVPSGCPCAWPSPGDATETAPVSGRLRRGVTGPAPAWGCWRRGVTGAAPVSAVWLEMGQFVDAGVVGVSPGALARHAGVVWVSCGDGSMSGSHLACRGKGGALAPSLVLIPGQACVRPGMRGGLPPRRKVLSSCAPEALSRPGTLGRSCPPRVSPIRAL